MISQPPPIDTIAALKRYLTDRAIPIDDMTMRRYGIELCGSERISEILGFRPGANPIGIGFNYPGTDYGTVRLLGSQSGPRCPKGKAPHAYLSPSVDWNSVKGRLILCESPLKAITLCLSGYQAISAGGTTTIYMAGKQRWCVGFPHAAIESGSITRVSVAWDSDTEDGINHNVERDLRVLCRALKDRHPNVVVDVQVLPAPPSGDPRIKWGVDDARALYGKDWLRDWIDDPRFTRAPGQDVLQDHFDELNARYVVCHNPSGVLDQESKAVHSAGDFKALIEAPRHTLVEDKRVAVAPLWLAWSDRRMVREIRYHPGGPKIVDGDYMNTWKEDGVVPTQGDVTPWLRLIHSAIDDDEVRGRMVQCMAYQVQYRGGKLPKVLYFTGRKVGTGKSTMAKIMAKILGASNSSIISKQDFEGAFNASYTRKELAILDDCEQLSRGSWANMKSTITSDEVNISQKYMKDVYQPIYTVLYITANQSDVVAFDADERRILMISFDPDELHRGDEDRYWRDFYHWLDNGGYEAVAHYLATYDLDGFDPNFFPPMTATKSAALAATQSEEDAFFNEFIDDPLRWCPAGRNFITPRQLYLLCYGDAPRDMSALRDFTQKLNAKEYLKKVDDKRIRIGDTMTTVYKLPGVPTPRMGGSNRGKVDWKAIRTNFEKYPNLDINM